MNHSNACEGLKVDISIDCLDSLVEDWGLWDY